LFVPKYRKKETSLNQIPTLDEDERPSSRFGHFTSEKELQMPIAGLKANLDMVMRSSERYIT